ncbi:MAG: hypothetical protein WC934_06310 [Acidithiobacillus sp.]|jgi:hypothetical protein|uniref:hypothetical protein n=1 Tax=Acidithiobacillus sp. TaxID=1872118 RepID=UPI00355FDAAE
MIEHNINNEELKKFKKIFNIPDESDVIVLKDTIELSEKFKQLIKRNSSFK